MLEIFPNNKVETLFVRFWYLFYVLKTLIREEIFIQTLPVSKGELSADVYSSEGERLVQKVNTRIWQIKHT